MDFIDVRERIAPKINEEKDLHVLFFLKGIVDGRIFRAGERRMKKEQL